MKQDKFFGDIKTRWSFWRCLMVEAFLMFFKSISDNPNLWAWPSKRNIQKYPNFLTLN
jgi:hypothetical protein